MYIHTYRHTYIHTFKYTYIYVYIYVYKSINIYIHIYRGGGGHQYVSYRLHEWVAKRQDRLNSDSRSGSIDRLVLYLYLM
jgi:hypothetical protein